MAEETKKTAAEEAVVCDVPVAEETKTTAAEAAEEVVVCDVSVAEEPVVEKEKECEEESKVAESVSFKEESNKVDDLIDPQKKALDEFKQLIQEALNKHDFTAPPPPSAAKEEVKKEEPKPQTEEEEKTEEPKPQAEEEKKEELEKTETCEEKETPTPCAEPSEAAEEIKETIVQEVKAEEAPPPAPEEVSIWGVPLLADERSDAILLKFLRARDFKVKEALAMLKNVVAWRKEFKIEELLAEEGLGEGLEKVVYVNGADKEGHPICYNAFGEFQDKELYSNTFPYSTSSFATPGLTYPAAMWSTVRPPLTSL
ncbi:patellin-1-like [Salvia miltiorrhiza]|uniref:patellin-1-like n=1 Tax=Salvia miltiorrhiza TaxID=226208 RepID=UPI0025AC27DE|nr:patellin-1-like [Salvia miltiorrhiza]